MSQDSQQRKRERAQTSEAGEERIRDPMEVFDTEIVLVILRNLDAQSLALSLLVSHRWNSVASTDTLWASKYEGLKLQKAHIPRSSQVRGLTKLAAYSLSIMDGKRTRITKYDLCDHVWEFRFNKAAPQYWRELDPYWRGEGGALVRRFEGDGSVRGEAGDKTWGGHESSYCIVTSFVADGTIREHYVRINRWPRMSVRRNRDWSWNMANALCCYSSLPDPHKPHGTGPQLPAAYYMN